MSASLSVSIASNSLRNEANQNGVFDEETQTIDLSGGAGGCGEWLNQSGAPSAPNCVYLVRAEQRFGNGDGEYTLDEQTRAFNSYYNSFRNKNFFTDRPRQVRLGLEVNF